MSVLLRRPSWSLSRSTLALRSCGALRTAVTILHDSSDLTLYVKDGSRKINRQKEFRGIAISCIERPCPALGLHERRPATTTPRPRAPSTCGPDDVQHQKENKEETDQSG